MGFLPSAAYNAARVGEAWSPNRCSNLGNRATHLIRAAYNWKIILKSVWKNQGRDSADVEVSMVFSYLVY